MNCPLIKNREIDEVICLAKCKVRKDCIDKKLGRSAVYAIAVRNPRISIKHTINVLEKQKLAEKILFVKVSAEHTNEYRRIKESDLVQHIESGNLPAARDLDIYESGSRVKLETKVEYKLTKIKDAQ